MPCGNEDQQSFILIIIHYTRVIACEIPSKISAVIVVFEEKKNWKNLGRKTMRNSHSGQKISMKMWYLESLKDPGQLIF